MTDSRYVIHPTPELHPSSLCEEPDYSTIDSTIRQLEADIVDRKAKLHAWRLYRNSRAKISRLPNELLIDIWKYLAFDEITPKSSGWFRLTHVCSHWRQTAINCPTLWRKPCLIKPYLAQVMIKRARDASLCLELDGDSVQRGKKELAVSTIQKNLNRAISLTLKGSHTLNRSTIRSAPFLREVRIERPGIDNSYLNLFAKALPNLTVTSLVDCDLLNRPDMIHSRLNIKHLSVNNSSESRSTWYYRSPGASRASLNNVLESLANFPKLQT